MIGHKERKRSSRGIEPKTSGLVVRRSSNWAIWAVKPVKYESYKQRGGDEKKMKAGGGGGEEKTNYILYSTTRHDVGMQ